MKKFYFFALLSYFVCYNSLAQTLIPVSNELILPQYAYSGATLASRVQYTCRLKLTGLTPNTVYRYNVGMSSFDNITTTYAKGMLFAIRNGNSDPYFTSYGNVEGLVSSKALNGSSIQNDLVAINATGYYGRFTSDASGEYTGWFASSAIGNATEQAVGSNVYFYVQLQTTNTFAPAVSYRTTSTIKLLDYSTTVNDPNGSTAIIGTSTVGNEKMVAIYDNTTFTGRPLYLTWTENDGLALATSFSTWYGGVDATAGSWGAIIPNALSNGIRGIQFYNQDGSLISVGNGTPNISTDGVWNTVSTVNPTGGTTPITINSIAPTTLPITLSSFTGESKNYGIKLNWTTAQEVNNQFFELLRSGEDKNFISIGRVTGAGNSSELKNYSFDDISPLKGTNYYQLKQFDFDGKSKSFDPINVKFGLSEDNFRVLSSSESSVVVSISSSKAKEGVISYIGLDGRILYKQKISVSSGLNTFTIPVNNSTGKIGVISFISGNEQESLKISR